MKNENANVISSTEDGPFQQFELSLDQVSSLDARWEETPAPAAPTGGRARAQEHLRRLGVAGLSETDSRRTAKTEYVMRLLVSGRAPLEEPPAAVPGPLPEPEPSAAPGPELSAVPELSPCPEPSAVPEPSLCPEPSAVSGPPPGVMTLENLTFDDLLAELENL